MGFRLHSKSKDRRYRDEERREMREMFGEKRYKSPKVAKIAYNRLYVPEEEPPKWYKESSLTQDREDAVKQASNIIRRGEAQYARVYRQWTEDGIMWGVETYPRIIPWYVKEGLVKDEYEEETENRKKKNVITKAKRPFGKKAGTKLQSFYGIKTDIGGKAGNMLQSIYRVKTVSSAKPKRKVIKRRK